MAEDVKLYRYYVREKPEYEGQWTSWAIVVLGSDGFFSTIGDYGNYSYGWWNWGSGDFRQFILDLCCKKGEHSYFLSKVSKKDELDVEATVAHVKEYILDKRRRGRWSEDPPRRKVEWWQEMPKTGREKAREEWDLLMQLRDGEITIDEWVRESRLDDAWEMPVYCYDHQAQHFAKQILPVLGEAIEAELAAEAALTTV